MNEMTLEEALRLADALAGPPDPVGSCVSRVCLAAPRIRWSVG
jgi:hypothetical protein